MKLFVDGQKDDTADAEAIGAAEGQPNTRFVAVKGEVQQASATNFEPEA